MDCIMMNSPCFEAAYSRLLLVPYDAFVIFSHYYSEADAAILYNLMVQNVITKRNLMDALIARDGVAATATLEQWRRNNEILADQYASMNPYWTKEQWNSLLDRDMQLKYQQMLALITGECPRTFDIFDRVKAQAVLIGDYQARGIMRGLRSIQETLDGLPNASTGS
ncbi:hypothetical protein MASR2M70_16790 [Bacillota bacterium]